MSLDGSSRPAHLTDEYIKTFCRVFGNSAKETSAPPSVWRYYLLMNRPETSDSQFMWGEFIARNNTELLNNLGNFVNRVSRYGQRVASSISY